MGIFFIPENFIYMSFTSYFYGMKILSRNIFSQLVGGGQAKYILKMAQWTNNFYLFIDEVV